MNETILLVEDHEAVRATAARILRARGYTVLEAGDGHQALRVAAAQGHPIDLLVSDVILPHLGGRALFARLLALMPEIKVLFLSGHSPDTVARYGLLETGYPLLHKPFTATALVEMVRWVLNGNG